ncbi:amino acid synthesis family protein [Spirillospora sp. NBC_00431]
MEFRIHRTITQVTEDRVGESGPATRPLRKVVAAAVLDNPYAGRFEADLGAAVEYSPRLGDLLAGMAVTALGEPAMSYGKGGVAGTAGTQEHAVMFVTTAFGDRVRDAVGGGAAWIASATLVGGPGTRLTIPLAHKDALYVRDHYDAATLHLDADCPRPHEVVVAVAVANRGRLDARLGGLAAADVVGEDGLS